MIPRAADTQSVALLWEEELLMKRATVFMSRAAQDERLHAVTKAWVDHLSVSEEWIGEVIDVANREKAAESRTVLIHEPTKSARRPVDSALRFASIVKAAISRFFASFVSTPKRVETYSALSLRERIAQQLYGVGGIFANVRLVAAPVHVRRRIVC
jgi:hypothetical protein